MGSGDQPARPIVGVGAVIVDAGKVLLVKRAHEPRKGEWSLPGGRVELGEALADAVRREVKEETGLDVDVGPVVEVVEHVQRQDGQVAHHFVIVDYLCTPAGGMLRAGDDAEAVVWVDGEELAAYGVSETAVRVIRRGLALAAGADDRGCDGPAVGR